MKRAICVVLTFLMLCTLLTGCGKKTATKENVKITIKVPLLAMECVTDEKITAADQFIKKAWDAFAAQYADYNVSADVIVFE